MNRIRDLRTAAGWTQAQLGARIGAVKSTVSGYEKEQHYLDTPTIHALCDLFGCTADYLLGRAERLQPEVTKEDEKFLAAYHALPLEIRRAVDGLMAPYMEPAQSKQVS